LADHETRREYTKRKLKGNLIDRDTRVEVKKSRQIPVVLLLLIFALVFAMIFFMVRRLMLVGTEAETVWEKQIDGESASMTFRRYMRFGDGVIMYTRDGAEYTDGTGRSVWQKSYQMTNPICDVRDDYAVIADQGGTTAGIYSTEQHLGDVTTALPISKAVISGIGVSYMIQNDDSADYLMAYRKDGTAIDLTVKSVPDGDGYPFDIAVSPGGSQLLTSYIGIENGSMKESVVFRNFGEIGQNADAKRVVGGFIEEFEGHVVTSVAFADEEYSHAFYDGGIVFFSTRVLNSPEILKNEAIEEQILSVADSSAGCAVITEPGNEETARQLRIYDNNGKLTGKTDTEFSASGIEMTEQSVILYNSDRICAYTLKGRKIADISWDGKISSVCGTKKLREFVVAENGRYLYIKAK